MDPVSFAFLALIALVSGGIAYFADWLGRHLGKKRLRLAGLRPRHTAGVFVVASGVLISLFTIGLVFLFSSDVRQWIQKGRTAIRELKEAEKQRDSAISDNRTILQQNGTLRVESQKRKGEIDSADATLDKIRRRAKTLQAQTEEFRLAAQDLSTKLVSEQDKFLASTQSLHATEQQRAEVQQSLSDIRKQFTSLTKSYHTLDQSWTELRAQSHDIEQYNRQLTSDNMRLTASNKDLESKGKDLEQKNEDAAQKLDLQTREIDRQSAELDDYATKIRLAKDMVDQLNVITKSSREQPPIFLAHQEIARAYLPAHLTLEAANDAITSLLREARDKAQDRGAKSSAPDRPCAAIFSHEDPKSHREISPDEIVDALVHRIAGRPTEQVLVASSSLNAFEGEPVSIELKEYPNPLVYHRDQVIAEIRMDRTEDKNTILVRVLTLLQQKVRDRAKKDNLIPDGDGNFGKLDMVEVSNILEAVKNAGRPVRLQAVVESDTRAGDPLQIELRVR